MRSFLRKLRVDLFRTAQRMSNTLVCQSQDLFHNKRVSTSPSPRSTPAVGKAQPTGDSMTKKLHPPYEFLFLSAFL